MYLLARTLTCSSPQCVQDQGAKDARNIMRALAVRRHNPRIPIFVEVLTPEAKNQFLLIPNCVSICVTELTMVRAARERERARVSH